MPKDTLGHDAQGSASESMPPWKRWLEDSLPLYGHRNWIVVADSAYPAQSRTGIETIVADEDQDRILEEILSRLGTSSHVRPVVYVDKELAFVDEADAPGVSEYRQWLSNALGDSILKLLPHEEIISKLDAAASMFSVTIFKSTLTIPYTSVFFELDCAYWTAEAENRLRLAMQE